MVGIAHPAPAAHLDRAGGDIEGGNLLAALLQGQRLPLTLVQAAAPVDLHPWRRASCPPEARAQLARRDGRRMFLAVMTVTL
jgi:hypothetical protein